MSQTTSNPQEAAKPPLRIVEFHARSIQKLKAVTIRPDPSKPVVLLTGKNRQGKTSILDGIWMAIGGKSCIPSKPIRQGEKDAEASIDFGEFYVIRKITENGEYLDVRSKEGFKAPKPQDFLNSKLGHRARNPLEFMRLKPDEQVKALQDMVSIKLDPAKFESISGLPMKGVKLDDPVALMDMGYKHLYGKRTDVNKEVTRLEKVFQSIEIPKGMEDTERIKVEALFEEKKELEKAKAANDKQRSNLCYMFDIDYQLLDNEISQDLLEIEKLTEKLLKLKKAAQEKALRQSKLGDQINQLYLTVEELQDPDFTDINARIASADEVNSVAAKVEERTKTYNELIEQQAKSKDFTDKLQAIKAYKTKLIQEAGLPVPGLGFDEGEVTYNGIPLSQASTREQIEISCAICAASNPEIGVLTVDRGWNDLDSEGKQTLIDFAEKKGLQIWCTAVQEEPGEDGFHIYDGSVVAVDGVEVEEEDRGDGDGKVDVENMTPVSMVPGDDQAAADWIK